MSKKKIVFANWKMNLDRESIAIFLEELLNLKFNSDKVDIVIAPPLVYLSDTLNKVLSSKISVASQNTFYEHNGPYTGEVSVDMLKDIGCTWVMIGHSERRQHLFETNEMINKKVLLASENGLKVICCLGETYEERRQGKTFSKIFDQLKRALREVDEKHLSNIVIGYEPIWVIGSGKAAELNDIKEAHDFINLELKKMYPNSKQLPRIVYGGSVDSNNIEKIINLNNVDGVLVGSASLDCEKFCDIVIKTEYSND